MVGYDYVGIAVRGEEKWTRDHWIARRERDIISNRSAIFAGPPAFVTSSPEFPDFSPNPRDIRRCRNLTNS